VVVEVSSREKFLSDGGKTGSDLDCGSFVEKSADGENLKGLTQEVS
jgi:hypothetical protein